MTHADQIRRDSRIMAGLDDSETLSGPEIDAAWHRLLNATGSNDAAYDAINAWMIDPL